MERGMPLQAPQHIQQSNEGEASTCLNSIDAVQDPHLIQAVRVFARKLRGKSAVPKATSLKLKPQNPKNPQRRQAESHTTGCRGKMGKMGKREKPGRRGGGRL